MEIRTHTLHNQKIVELPLPVLSRAITRLYTDQKSLFKQFETMILSGEYVTPTIYFVKRKLINFDIDDLWDALDDIRPSIRRPLYLSFKTFLENNDTHAFSMYLVKNRHVKYVK